MESLMKRISELEKRIPTLENRVTRLEHENNQFRSIFNLPLLNSDKHYHSQHLYLEDVDEDEIQMEEAQRDFDDNGYLNEGEEDEEIESLGPVQKRRRKKKSPVANDDKKQKGFECTGCHKKFIRTRGHAKNHHQKNLKFRCPEEGCCKAKNFESMVRHLEGRHEYEISEAKTKALDVLERECFPDKVYDIPQVVAPAVHKHMVQHQSLQNISAENNSKQNLQTTGVTNQYYINVADALGKSNDIHMEIDGRIFDISKSKKSKIPYSSQKSIESSFKQDVVIELDESIEGAEVQETEINSHESCAKPDDEFESDSNESAVDEVEPKLTENDENDEKFSDFMLPLDKFSIIHDQKESNEAIIDTYMPEFVETPVRTIQEVLLEEPSIPTPSPAPSNEKFTNRVISKLCDSSSSSGDDYDVYEDRPEKRNEGQNHEIEESPCTKNELAQTNGDNFKSPSQNSFKPIQIDPIEEPYFEDEILESYSKEPSYKEAHMPRSDRNATINASSELNKQLLYRMKSLSKKQIMPIEIDFNKGIQLAIIAKKNRDEVLQLQSKFQQTSPTADVLSEEIELDAEELRPREVQSIGDKEVSVLHLEEDKINETRKNNVLDIESQMKQHEEILDDQIPENEENLENLNAEDTITSLDTPSNCPKESNSNRMNANSDKDNPPSYRKFHEEQEKKRNEAIKKALYSISKDYKLGEHNDDENIGPEPVPSSSSHSDLIIPSTGTKSDKFSSKLNKYCEENIKKALKGDRNGKLYVPSCHYFSKGYYCRNNMNCNFLHGKNLTRGMEEAIEIMLGNKLPRYQRNQSRMIRSSLRNGYRTDRYAYRKRSVSRSQSRSRSPDRSRAHRHRSPVLRHEKSYRRHKSRSSRRSRSRYRRHRYNTSSGFPRKRSRYESSSSRSRNESSSLDTSSDEETEKWNSNLDNKIIEMNSSKGDQNEDNEHWNENLTKFNRHVIK